MEMFESSTNGALWTGSKGPSETNVHHAPPPPNPASNRVLRKDLGCHLSSASAPELGPPGPAHWVHEPPGRRGEDWPGPGLASPGRDPRLVLLEI